MLIVALALLTGCSYQRVIPVYEDSETDYPGVQSPPSPSSIRTNIPNLAPSQTYAIGPSQQSASFPQFSYDFKSVQDTSNELSKINPVGVPSVTPLQTATHLEKEYDINPKYEFAYEIEDRQTGDIHSQKETRNGDLVHGEYSFREADGTIRTVTYSVDKQSGFNAVVRRTGQAVHTQPTQGGLNYNIPKNSDTSDYQYH